MTEHEGLYAAFKAKDLRFDGRFFVGISSTGIYCRPVCRAKQSKAENCTFYASAAEAERAGYRPCLLCRPELAPAVSGGAALAQRAAGLLEEHCGSGFSLEELAKQLGCTGRHLRRAFAAEYRVTPVEYLQTCRLLLAKRLLTDTKLSVLEVAMTAGFGSLRRFNELFRRRYHLSPTALRKKLPTGAPADWRITLSLRYRPPYRYEELLRFLDGRTIPGVELVEDGAYWRTVRLVDGRGRELFGWLRVTHQPEQSALAVMVSESLLPVLPQVLVRVRQLFDLYCDPMAVHEALAPMNELRSDLCMPGTRLPGCFDAFEMAVRAILGQQITVKAARTLAARLVSSYGRTVETDHPSLTCVFPAPEELLVLPAPMEERLGSLGVLAARSRAIEQLAKGLFEGHLKLDHRAKPEEEMKKLTAIPGIGSWTAGYIAMRTMGWTDAFLETDAGIKKALPGRTAKELLGLAEPWRPWRSYATISLWNSLYESV